MKIVTFLSLLLIFQNIYSQKRTLQGYLSAGLTGSPLLQHYNNQVFQVRIDSLRLLASWGPRINAVSDNYFGPVVKGWGQDEIITDKANFNALISASKELVSKANRTNQFRSISLDITSLQISKKMTELNLRKLITEQYILAYSDLLQFGFNTDLLTLLKNEDVIFKRLTEQGIYKQTDYLAFRVVLGEQELGIQQITARYLSDLNQLNSVCGLSDTSWVILSDPQLIPSEKPVFGKSLILMQFQNDSLKLETQNKQVDFTYKPKINVFANAGYFSSLSETPWKNFGPAFGFNLDVPIYDGNQRKMQHDRILMDELTRKGQLTFSRTRYEQQINGLFQQLRTTEMLKLKTAEQVKLSEALVDANRKLLETGSLHITEYMIALQNYLVAKNAVLQNMITRYLIINEINHFELTE